MITIYEIYNKEKMRGSYLSEVQLLKLIRICESMKYKTLANKLISIYEQLENPKKYDKKLLN